MAKIKLSKNELKRQKEALERFNHYLPMLVLKKQQLQFELSKIDHAICQTQEKIETREGMVSAWVSVFGEEVGLSQLLVPEHIKVETGNVAGIDIPLFREVEFKEQEYDLLLTPLWVDKAIEVCKELISLRAQILIYQQQRDILSEELRITTQRVNLFEKVKIPQARENIRIINVYLGDLQTAEVVRGKIAKAKIEQKRGAVAI